MYNKKIIITEEGLLDFQHDLLTKEYLYASDSTRNKKITFDLVGNYYVIVNNCTIKYDNAERAVEDYNKY
jgi:hypothetical protein